jgi:hypothetical protein
LIEQFGLFYAAAEAKIAVMPPVFLLNFHLNSSRIRPKKWAFLLKDPFFWTEFSLGAEIIAHMKALLLLALLAIAPLHVAFAEEPRTITTLSGEKFEKATVTGVTPYGISITHSSGVAFARFADLPDDVRKLYGYDPAKIAAADAAAIAQRDAEAAKQKRDQEQKAEAERRDAPRKAALRRWASQNLMNASREDQLRAAMAAKFFEQRKGRPLSAAEYSFLDQDSKIALILYFPELLPPELTAP